MSTISYVCAIIYLSAIGTVITIVSMRKRTKLLERYKILSSKSRSGNEVKELEAVESLLGHKLVFKT